MQMSLSSTSMNVITHLLFSKIYFNTMHINENCEKFKDIVVKVMNLIGVLNISDYVQFLKPFDLQGLQLQCNQIRLKVDQFLGKFIQEHLKEKKRPNESKDFLDVMLPLRGVNGVSNRLDEITIKAIINVSHSMLL